MARRQKISSSDFVSGAGPSWANKIHQDYLADKDKKENARSQALELAEQMRLSGETVSDRDVSAMADQFYRYGELRDFVPEASRQPEQKDVPTLPSKNPSITGFDSDIVNDVTLALRAGNSSVASGLIGLPVRAINAVTDPLPARIGRGLVEAVLGEDSEAAKRLKSSSDLLRVDQPEAVRGTQEGISRATEEEFSEYASDTYKEGRKRYADAKGFLDTAKTMVTDPRTTLLTAAEQIPALVLGRVRGSTAGTVGAQSALAGANTEAEVASELAKKVASGEMTRKEAEGIASTAFAFSAGMNAGVSLIPGATVLDRAIAGTAVPKSAVLAAARSTAAKKATAGLVGEGLSGGASEAGDQIITNVSTGKPWSEDVAKQFATGAILEGPLGGTTGAIEGRRERALYDELDADALEGAGLEGFLTERDQFDNRINKELFEAEQDVASQEETARIAAEREAAFAAQEQQRVEEERRKQIEEEAGFRTMEIERTTGGSRVERYGTSELPEERGRGTQVVERVPIQPAAEVTPEQVLAEQEAAAEQERVAREQEELAPYNAVLLREMEAERKRKEKEEAKKTSQQKAEERKREGEVARQLLAENPGKDITELAPLLRERLAQPAVEEATTPKATTVEERVASVRNRLSAAAKAEQTKQDNERLKSLIRRNPNATDAEIAAMFEGSTVPETAQVANTSTSSEPVAPVVTTGDSSVDNFLTTLNMESPTPEALQSAEVNIEEFRQKLRDLGKRLSRRATPEAVGTQNLIRTGKLVVAPNAASIGRSDNAPAVYDTATGKMYMYTDSLTDGDDVGAMVAALHESTHAGQFNDRDGRDNILRSIMGKERYDAAQARVRAIARKQIREGKQGPERAAVEAAEAAALANPDFNGDVEALEVMPYYVGEAARRRAEMSGVRSVAKDIVGAGRKFLRDNLGMDLDVNMQDIDYAARRVAGEIVETELTPSQDNGQLEMVVGGRFTNDPRQRYKGAIDGLERYVMSDAEAEVMAEYIPALQRGQMIPLGKLLNHPRLYQLYPQLRDVRVVLDDDQKGYGAGVFNPNTGEIGLSEESVANLDSEEIRNTVLHETQHAVQHIEGFIAGENWERLMSPMYKADEQRDRQRRDRAINRFDLGRWKQTTTPTRLQEFNNEVAARGIAGDTFAQSQLVLQNGWNADSTDRIVKRYGETVYNPARDALNASLRALNAENKRAMDLYYSNYGEAEARTTEYASRMSQRELDNVSFEELFPEARNGVRVEDTLDTLGYGGGRTPDQSRSTSLEMADTQTPEAKRDSSTANNDSSATSSSSVLQMAAQQSSPEAVKQRKLPMWFYNLFDSSKGVSRDINAAVEAAAASPAGDYMLAEKTVGKYQTALRKLASSRGTTYDKLNKQIETELAQLKPQGSWAANKQEFNKVVSKYGDAGKHLMDLRDQIDGLSMEMLKQRAAQGGNVTEAEKKSYKAIAANLGYYTNRQYAALTGESGKEFAEKVWNDYERYKRGGKKDPVREKNYQIVAKAVQRLVDDSLRIPDDVGIADMSADQLRRMYATWVGPAEGVDLDAMRTELANRRDLINGDQNRLNNEAEAIAHELLGLVDATRPVTDFFRGAKLDKGILQERSHMPQEIRDLLGEITDPAMKMLLTVGKQAEFTARNKLLLDLRNQVGRDIQPPDAAGTPQVRGMSVLKGELWGPLEGYYASPNMQALVGDMIQQIATFEQAMALAAVRPSVLNDKVVTEALGKWGKAASATKMLQIVGTPMNFIYNYVGAYGSMLNNGNVNPKNVTKAHKAMYELIRYAGDSTTAGDEARRMASLGITDSAFIGEIKSGQYRSLNTLIKGMSGENTTLTQIGARLHHAKAVTSETYAMMDVWGKMANFYQQVDVLTDFYKKNGDKKTAEEIDREAADIVNRTNITYKRAAPIIKALEKAGITQFGTYFYEVFRSQAANFAQGINEYNRARTAKTPEARNAMLLQAGKRIGGQVALWHLLGFASAALNSAVFGDDDEEAEKKRKLLAEYQRDQDFVKVGTDANGKPILFNVSRFDPIGPATDFMRTIMHGEMTGEELRKKLIDLYVAPRLAGQLYKAIDATVSNGNITRTPSTQQWFPEVYGEALQVVDPIPGVDDNATRGWTNVLEMFVLPGASNALRDTNPKVTDNEANAAFFGMMRFMGLSLAAVDAEKATGFAAREYNDTLKAVRKDVADLFRDRPNVTEAEALEKVLEFTDDERKAAKKLSDIYQGMLAMDKSEREAMAIFKEQGVPTTAIRTIANGNYVPQTISQKSIKTFADREMQGKTLAEKREIKQKWDNVWEILSQVDAKIKESE